MIRHLGIDTEGLTAGDPQGVVLTLAAVRFDPLSGVIDDYLHFDLRLTLFWQIRAGRTINPETVRKWQEWQADPFENSEPVSSLGEASKRLSEYWDGCSRVWCRGEDHDFSLLRSLLGALPWDYRAQREARNLDDLVEYRRPPEHLAHNALADAGAMAEHIQKAAKTLRDAGVKVAL